MSCSGCRVLRKGCSETCVLRGCLQWIDSPEAQGHATVFVAKFFGRAGLMSFVSAVPESRRSALFQSLLYEAAGRTINPVNGAVGLLGTGNWHLCQEAVETVLRGGALRPLPLDEVDRDRVSEAGPAVLYAPPRDPQRFGRVAGGLVEPSDLDLSLSTASAADRRPRKRPGTPSEESATTTVESGVRTGAAAPGSGQKLQPPPRLLNLFFE